jgi:hypothetical protein
MHHFHYLRHFEDERLNWFEKEGDPIDVLLTHVE